MQKSRPYFWPYQFLFYYLQLTAAADVLLRPSSLTFVKSLQKTTLFAKSQKNNTSEKSRNANALSSEKIPTYGYAFPEEQKVLDGGAVRSRGAGRSNRKQGGKNDIHQK
jgi:hypothetical protein